MSLFGNKVPADVLALSGTRVPKFERSVVHAGTKDGVKVINEVLAIEDPDGALWAEFSQTKAGQDILAGYQAWILFALGRKAPAAS